MAADAQKLLRRLEQVKSRRAVVEEAWRDCYRYTYPLRGAGFEHVGTVSDPMTTQASTAKAKQADLLDSTGTDAARLLASAIVSGTVPANSRWIAWDQTGMSDEEKLWADDAAQSLWENIHASNFDGVAFECMLDYCAAGMFALFCDEAPEGGFLFEAWPLANCYFAASKNGGPVDTVFNEFPLTAEQAVREYGENMVSDKVRELAASKPDEVVEFVRCIYPRTGAGGMLARNQPIASVHIEKESKQLVRESGYHEMPLCVPRWNTLQGSCYAFGPTYEALPDLKTLNEVVRMDLANMDLAIAGMWGAVDDGVLNPRTVTIGPRKIVVMAAKDNMWPLQPAGKYEIAQLEIERLQRAIRKVMMADQLQPQDGPQMTATEVVVRVEIIRQLLGPVYGRTQSEFISTLVQRCFGIAYRAGALAQAPESLADKVLTLRYISPIARAQKLGDVAAMDRYEGMLAQEAAVVGEGPLDMYDWDEAARTRAELLGVPQKLIPDQRDIAERRAKRAQQQQAAQTMEAVKQFTTDGNGLINGMVQ